MKKQGFYYVNLASLLLFFLTGCNSDEQADAGKGEPIRMATSVERLASTRVDASSSDITASNTKIPNGQTVDVFVTASNDDSAIGNFPTEYAVSNSNLTVLGHSPQYWPQKSVGNIKVFGVKPSGVNTLGYFDVKTEQAYDSEYLDSDLLFCNQATYTDRTTSVVLPFRHALSKVIIEVEGTSSSATVTDVEMDCMNVHTHCVFAKGTATAPITAETKVSVVDDNPVASVYLGKISTQAKYRFACILPPQTIYKQFVHLVTTLKSGNQGKTYQNMYWTPDEPINLVAGYCYTITLSLKQSLLTLKNTTITPWTDSGVTLLDKQINVPI